MPIITGSVVGSNPASRPALCFDNLFTKAGSFVATGTDYENAFDYFPYDAWTTAATSGSITFTGASAYSADYFAISAHTLHEVSGTITLEYYNGAAWVQVAAIAPSDQYPSIVFFDKQTSNQWRVLTTSSSAALVGVIFAGELLAMVPGFYVGYAPVTLSHTDVLYNNRAQHGNFLGRSVIRRGVSGSIQLDHMTPAFVRDHYKAFIDHALTYPWFIVANQVTHLDEVGYCWTTRNLNANNSHINFMDSALQFEGMAR